MQGTAVPLPHWTFTITRVMNGALIVCGAIYLILPSGVTVMEPEFAPFGCPEVTVGSAFPTHV